MFGRKVGLDDKYIKTLGSFFFQKTDYLAINKGSERMVHYKLEMVSKNKKAVYKKK